jgi:hypothetical protein
MTATLTSILDSTKATDPSIYGMFFNSVEKEFIKGKYTLPRECPEPGFPPSCDANLFFGFFFDGTNNNLKRDRAGHSQSNVARLFESFPGGKDKNGSEAWPDLASKYHNSFFRTYVPGVGTPFDSVNDSGEGSAKTKGLAFCYLGENRIIWALVEAINNLHRYYKSDELISDAKFKSTFNNLILPRFQDRNLTAPYSVEGSTASKHPSELFTDAFTDALKDLHAALKSYVPIGEGKLKDHGVVKNIFVSMFGFSRGAAEARVFSNWFVWLCQLDAKIAGQTGMSLGTVPVTIDFLGIFDTVASVGLAASAIITDGHQAWADSESSLKIPSEPKKCLHIVSAHEIRRSFPLDSVAYKGVIPPNCIEMVCPGVHSDVGGGYVPLDQGRGKDSEGSDLISRITLATMYRAARLAGVPLKLEEAPEAVKRSFKIDPSIIQTFNAYVQFCATAHGKKTGEEVIAPLHILMAQQHKLYILWRKKMVGKMGTLTSVEKDSDKHAREDILKADKEFSDEIGYFQTWRKHQGVNESEQRPPIPEWVEIDKFWDEPAPPSEVTNLFEQFVHDSRAWFKPLGNDVPDLQEQMDKLVMRHEKAIEWEKEHPNYSANESNPYELTAAEKAKFNRYAPYKDKANKSEGLDAESKGREPMALGAGYLRYRKIYMGSNHYKPSGAMYAGLRQIDSNKRRGPSLQQEQEFETAVA